jgi:lysophospholipase L1-like esterase
VIDFRVHPCEYIPVVGKGEERSSPISVYILSGEGSASAELISVKRTVAPTVWIAGDSLVADYLCEWPYNPFRNYGSWAQFLPQYFGGAAFVNEAHGGMTTETFREDGHWDLIERNLQPGDAVFMEFGHNDQKRRHLAAYGGYATNLRRYITGIRAKHAYPVLVTPLSRIPGKDEDGYFDYLTFYAEALQYLGKTQKVPVIDLHAGAFSKLCELGPARWGAYFMDSTHTNDYGAMQGASFVAAEVIRQKIQPLCSLKSASTGTPPLPDPVRYAAEGTESSEKEERPVLSTDLPELPYADCHGIPEENILREAMSEGLMDPCYLYFRPQAEIPRAQFLYMLYLALPLGEKLPYSGIYHDIDRYEFIAPYVEKAWKDGLIDPQTTPDGCFRPDDPLTEQELYGFFSRASGRRAGTKRKSRHRVTRAECVAALLTFKKSLQ